MALWWHVHKCSDFSAPTSAITIVHGGARGVDELAGKLAAGAGYDVEVHEANWVKLGKGAGPIRNQEMVDLGANLVLAFPAVGSKGKGGTWDLIHRAADANMTVHIHPLRIPADEGLF